MEVVTMAHGAGGTVMQQLIRDYMLKHLGGSHAEVPLEAVDDAARTRTAPPEREH